MPARSFSRRSLLQRTLVGAAALSVPGLAARRVPLLDVLGLADARAATIGGASLGPLYRYNTSSSHYLYGDTFTTAWADDGNLYLVMDDTTGWNGAGSYNFNVNILPDDPSNHPGVLVNAMSAYGGKSQQQTDSDGVSRAWKAGGIACIDGVLYLSVTPTHYGDSRTTPQTGANGSIVKSTDHGASWVNHLGQTNTPPPRNSSAMFPGSCGGWVFIEHGQNGAAGPSAFLADSYVYAVTTDAWNNGNTMSLARIPRGSDLLSVANWQFYSGPAVVHGDEPLNGANWSSSYASATPIYSNSGHVNFADVKYVPGLGKYIFFNYFYTWDGPLEQYGYTSHTTWQLMQSETPWGPYTPFLTQDFPNNGFYIPTAPSKWIAADGLSMWLLFAGDFSLDTSYSWSDTKYTMYIQQLSLSQAANAVANPGFESGTTSWSTQSAAVVAGSGVGGSAALAATGGNSGCWQSIGGLTAGRTYTLGAYIKGDAGDAGYLFAKNFGGAQVVSSSVSRGSYTYTSLTFTPTGSSAQIGMWKDSGAGAAYCDNVSLA